MGTLSGINYYDFLFVLFGTFVISLMISGFITYPNDGNEAIRSFIELFLIVLCVFFLIYYVMKSRAYKNASFIVQEKLYYILFVIILILGICLGANSIYSNRGNPRGFILFVLVITIMLVLIVLGMSNSAISKRYDLNIDKNTTNNSSNTARSRR